VGIPYSLRSIGVRVLGLVLCPSGILGKGTLRAYPWGRIPTHSHKVVKIATEVPDVVLVEVLVSDLVDVVQDVYLGKINLSVGN
jgi:hypothetical protein